MAGRQDAASPPALDERFRQLCSLATSKHRVQLDLPQTDAEAALDDDDAVCVDPALEEGAAVTYRSRTSFGRHFTEVARRADENGTEATPDKDITNPYFCPELVEHLLRSLMPLAPLWTQLLSACVTSNAAVEAHMRLVKHQLLVGPRP